MFSRKDRRAWGSGLVNRQRLAAAWQQRRLGNTGAVIEGGLAHIELVSGDIVLYLECDLRNTADAAGVPASWALAALLLVGATQLWRLANRLAIGQTVRVRLGSLLALVVALPLGGSILLVTLSSSDLDHVQRRTLLDRAYRELRSFDDGFQEEEARATRIMTRLVDDPAFARGDLKTVASLARSLLRRNDIYRIDIRDWSNRQVLLLANDTGNSEFTKMTQILGEYAINTFSPDPNATSTRMTPLLMAAQELSENVNLVVGEIMQAPRILWVANTSGAGFYVFWDVPRTRTGPLATCCMVRGIDNSVVGYLRRTLLKNRSVRLVGRVPIVNRWYPRNAANEALEQLADVVQTTGTMQQGTITWHGRPHLVVGMPGTRLVDTQLFALVPLDSWQEARQNAWRQLVLLMLAALGIAGLAARLLAESLVHPVDELIGGIAALRERRHAFRIPVRSRDELSRMAAAFNTMIANLDEWAMAEETQRTMNPEMPDWPAGYQAALTSAANRIDGRYFDVWSLGPNRTRFVIGEVTGTGVNAALVTAMLKAAWFIRHQEDDALEQLPALWESLVQDYGRGRSLHFIIGDLDADKHTVVLTLYGHVSVFLRRLANAAATDAGSRPMAATTTPTPMTMTVALTAGDRLRCSVGGPGGDAAAPPHFDLVRIAPEDGVRS